MGLKMAAMVLLIIDGVAYGEYAVDYGSWPVTGYIYLALGLGLYAVGEKVFPNNST